MPVIIDHQLKEQIPYNPAIYPISFYHMEVIEAVTDVVKAHNWQILDGSVLNID